MFVSGKVTRKFDKFLERAYLGYRNRPRLQKMVSVATRRIDIIDRERMMRRCICPPYSIDQGIYYGEHSARLIGDLYAEDIRRFGYTF